MAEENESYTTVAKVEQYWQRGSFSTGTYPTLAEVKEMMQMRGAEVTASLRSFGITATPPAGASELPAGDIKVLADQANAKFAAGDAIAAQDQRGEVEDVSATAIKLWEQAASSLQAIEALAEDIVGASAAGSRSATTTGGITKSSFTEDPNQGAERSRSDGFSLDTDW